MSATKQEHPLSATAWANADSLKRTDRLPAVRDTRTGCLTVREVLDWQETVRMPGRGFHAQECQICCSMVENLRKGTITTEQAVANVVERTKMQQPPKSGQTPQEQLAILARITAQAREKSTRRVAGTPGDLDAPKDVRTSTTVILKNGAARVGRWIGSITGIFSKKELEEAAKNDPGH